MDQLLVVDFLLEVDRLVVNRLVVDFLLEVDRLVVNRLVVDFLLVVDYQHHVSYDQMD
jgi:hypothetical protein